MSKKVVAKNMPCNPFIQKQNHLIAIHLTLNLLI